MKTNIHQIEKLREQRHIFADRFQAYQNWYDLSEKEVCDLLENIQRA